MIVLRLGHGRWGEVLACCSGREACPVLDFLESLRGDDEAHARKILYLLRERVPSVGPPANTEDSEPLGDGLFELKRGPLRVLYFYDSSRRGVVVCTHGFYKKRQKTPRAQLDTARRRRKEYLAAQERNEVRVIEI